MFTKKISVSAGVAAAAALLMVSGCATDSRPDSKDYTDMSSEELAEHLVFESGSFKLDQKVQEGGKARQRMVQDELQEACSVTGGGQPSRETLNEVRQMARESIEYPEDGIELGDWERGGELAWSGFGYRVGHKVDNHNNREAGGQCYNCHKLDPNRPGGTIGPSLTGYGKTRGNTEQTRQYVYDMIYNAHATFPCTDMPRFGAKGLLNERQIEDIMAYVLHPESPVNQ